MARDDEVRLYGMIDNVTREVTAEGKTGRVCADLLVVRRPQARLGNKLGDLKLAAVPVAVEDGEMIRYLGERKAMKGDMMDVTGVPCTIRRSEGFTCGSCGAKNPYIRTKDCIRPLFLRVREVHPKQAETVILTDAQRHGAREQVFEALNEKKRLAGRIVGVKDLGRTGDDRNSILITVREGITRSDVMRELDQVKEVSSLAWVEGRLCRAPEYSVTPAGGRTCSYQLDISQGEGAMEGGQEGRADYIWVRSFGDQAEKDRDSLMKGSLVLITGSIQTLGITREKECAVCHAMNSVEDSALEVIPYSVEYLKDCSLSGDDEDGGEFEGAGFDGWEGTGEMPAVPYGDE